MKSWIGVASALIAGVTASAALAQDAAKGERVFATQCKACHTLERGGASVTGPNLYGLMARKSGGLPGYGYSEAMRRFAIVWDEKTLANYLRDPKGDMPGTKMVFAGVKRPDQLADLIAYLKEATQ
ncbi:MAG: cytochrome c family protein [Alphaproteobacteria bacterium]|nr:cytochrome c family protein [Alphaproteobacteria bacterium]